MAEHEIRAAIAALVEEVAARPEAERQLRGAILQKIGELEALGLPVPAELLQFLDGPAEAASEDEFDNMPV